MAPCPVPATATTPTFACMLAMPDTSSPTTARSLVNARRVASTLEPPRPAIVSCCSVFPVSSAVVSLSRFCFAFPLPLTLRHYLSHILCHTHTHTHTHSHTHSLSLSLSLPLSATAVICPAVSAPTHGSVTGNCTGAYNGVCTYTCSAGFKLSVDGNLTRTCEQSGEYSGTAKNCEGE